MCGSVSGADTSMRILRLCVIDMSGYTAWQLAALVVRVVHAADAEAELEAQRGVVA